MESVPSWVSALVSVGTVLGSIVTAVATFFLWRITRVLARETRRMADLAAQPHVVATFEVNRWALHYFDLYVTNTGNATAYDIEVAFDPPLKVSTARQAAALPLPLQRISVLKPGAALFSSLADYADLQGKTMQVSISWRPDPARAGREVNAYTLSMQDFEGLTRLGSDPQTDIATNLKKIEASLTALAKGHARVQVDAFGTTDRQEEQRARDERLQQMRRDRGQSGSPPRSEGSEHL